MDERISELEENVFSEEAQQVIDSQAEKIVRLEKDLYNGLQHNRKWNVEIDGIPTDVGDEEEKLEEAVIKISTAIGVRITRDAIEACHRLPTRRSGGPKPTIVRFASRKIVGNIMKNKIIG